MISSAQSNLVVVISSCSNENVALALSERIIEGRFAGCIKMLPVKSSIYMWKGKLVKDSEVLLIIKTLKNKVAHLERFILEHHEYETPEFIVVPVSRVNEDYMAWIEQCIA
ncbi:MAG: hypothetical protein CBC29_03155 [Methylococcaceae bacterium TMED69]|nr:MAG: hypothetical protein CBC29_03155 [Methylococcaceae bacterium TMED69]|tara:strand:+ start:1333 stop:1665 length:333 start_codon:yes stop_codon:yes gene_type:complete